ncbi:RNA polymerase recycling motor HelD [Alicyclobacillus sp. ALC3]|uniref:RNA polymerase recycling motor HelD n=1 Tax=Alicyclobacillus sp. ALC3 TaxID=2796143 RepID=UPI002379356E|nr:RNA polymerase recycling motor HelD [Alicyclobacillus sp. ALC3]WDL97163.1 ATP-binding domain-containing protein [Alicyclobacillus sp. ALC3]
MDAKEWQIEQMRLNRVIEKIQERIAVLEPEVSGLAQQVRDVRKHFWEEVTVNTSTPEDFEETFYSINQQHVVLAERERGHRLLTQKWSNLNRLLPSPYFGRIDFLEDGLKFSEQVYIGVSSFIDEDGFDFLVYDWRSPVASMYYDQSPGPSFYDAPSGRVTGEMELKRQYQIQDGQLLNMFDASLTIGDDLLQQVLGKGADSQMKSIVATIQKEQNAIIRDVKSRMLIVQGAAGSGKTSAALQRVAFLLYKNRDALKADQVILFSPNSMFNSYVSTVLPELGEDNMQQATFQEYLEYELGALLGVEDPFDQIEYRMTARRTTGYEARLQGMKYKASENFLTALNNYALWLGCKGMMFNNIQFQDRELITEEQMRLKFYSYPTSQLLSNRVALLQKWLLDELTLLERQEMDAEWVQEELNYLDDDQYDEVFSELHKEREVFDIHEQFAVIQEKIHKKLREDEGDFNFAHREEELLRRKIVKNSFKPLRRSVKKLMFIDAKGLYRQLFNNKADFQEMTREAQLPTLWNDICKQTNEKMSRDELFYEDATPYLYLQELIEGTRTNTQIQYVFVDEGQDYSAFQYEYLKKLFPRARFTVLGDFRQAIFTQATNLHESDSSLTRLYGEDRTNVIYLIRSYRSTCEIVRFTKNLLPDGDDIVPFDRSGKMPVLIRFDSEEKRNRQLLKDIASLRSEGFDSIAIITKTAAESRKAYESLRTRGYDDVLLVTKQTLTFEKGVMTIPVYLAKGVEFDAVIIYDASLQAYNQEDERTLLYTACTRAMHRLLLYSVGDWSPFVRRMDRNLYELAPEQLNVAEDPLTSTK